MEEIKEIICSRVSGLLLTLLALALESETALIFCDDKKGINACKIFGISFITVLGFLESVFEQGLISKKEALDKLLLLKQAGWYGKEYISQLEGKIHGS